MKRDIGALKATHQGPGLGPGQGSGLAREGNDMPPLVAYSSTEGVASRRRVYRLLSAVDYNSLPHSLLPPFYSAYQIALSIAHILTYTSHKHPDKHPLTNTLSYTSHKRHLIPALSLNYLFHTGGPRFLHRLPHPPRRLPAEGTQPPLTYTTTSDLYNHLFVHIAIDTRSPTSSVLSSVLSS